MSDYFSDFDEETTSQSSNYSTETSQRDSSGGNRVYSQEVFSEKISAKYRTFFIDVKENAHGHLIKISEKSRGRKSTIMMDSEDLDDIITGLTNARNFIANKEE